MVVLKMSCHAFFLFTPQKRLYFCSMQKNPYFIIDFDSTFTRVEALDVLAEIVLAHSSKKDAVVQAIHEITNRGMNGELDFAQALRTRVALVKGVERRMLDEIRRERITLTVRCLPFQTLAGHPRPGARGLRRSDRRLAGVGRPPPRHAGQRGLLAAVPGRRGLDGPPGD